MSGFPTRVHIQERGDLCTDIFSTLNWKWRKHTVLYTKTPLISHGHVWNFTSASLRQRLICASFVGVWQPLPSTFCLHSLDNTRAPPTLLEAAGLGSQVLTLQVKLSNQMFSHHERRRPYASRYLTLFKLPALFVDFTMRSNLKMDRCRMRWNNHSRKHTTP